MSVEVARGTRIKLRFDDNTTLDYMPTPGLELGYVLMQIEQYARLNAAHDEECQACYRVGPHKPGCPRETS